MRLPEAPEGCDVYYAVFRVGPRPPEYSYDDEVQIHLELQCPHCRQGLTICRRNEMALCEPCCRAEFDDYGYFVGPTSHRGDGEARIILNTKPPGVQQPPVPLPAPSGRQSQV